MESELGEGFLSSSKLQYPNVGALQTHSLVDIQFSEYLGGIEEMLVIKYPTSYEHVLLLTATPVELTSCH